MDCKKKKNNKKTAGNLIDLGPSVTSHGQHPTLFENHFGQIMVQKQVPGM